jgi:hypothetical protein
MLIYSSKLRFLGRFCLVLPASPTFFNGLLTKGLSMHEYGANTRLNGGYRVFLPLALVTSASVGYQCSRPKT